jgi:hypothetical protein
LNIYLYTNIYISAISKYVIYICICVYIYTYQISRAPGILWFLVNIGYQGRDAI